MRQKLSDTHAIWILRAIGILGLLVGVAAVWIGPAEVHAFYLFLPGQRFAYEGYNWGSLMFALIAAQVAAYYGIGMLGLWLGWGHLRLRAWTLPIMRSLLWAWLLAGLPLMALAYLLLIISKGTTPVGLLLSLPFALVAYPLAPWLLYRWYGGAAVRGTFTQSGSPSGSLASLPPCVGGTIALLSLYGLALHLPMLVNGVFPWFGALLTDRSGLYAYGPLTLGLIGILWSLCARRRWAWWLAMVGLGFWTASTVLTFARYTLAEMLDLMALPATELGWFQAMPFLHQPVGLLGCLPPVVLMLMLLFVRKRYVGWCLVGIED